MKATRDIINDEIELDQKATEELVDQGVSVLIMAGAAVAVMKEAADLMAGTQFSR